MLIDLSSAGEVHGIVDDVKQLTGKFRVIVLGTEQEIGSLPRALHGSINGFLVALYTAGELTSVVALVCQQR